MTDADLTRRAQEMADELADCGPDGGLEIGTDTPLEAAKVIRDLLSRLEEMQAEIARLITERVYLGNRLRECRSAKVCTQCCGSVNLETGSCDECDKSNVSLIADLEAAESRETALREELRGILESTYVDPSVRVHAALAALARADAGETK